MSSVNRIILIGYLGRDPETRYTHGGDAVASFSMATSERWTDKQTGAKKEETTWHRVSLFGRLAEIAGQYLRKGSQCYVEGRYRSRKYQAKDGTEKTVYEVVGTGLTLLGKSDGRRDEPRAAEPAAQDDGDGDIPF